MTASKNGVLTVFQQGPQFSQSAIVSSPIRFTASWKVMPHPQLGQNMLQVTYR